jgi:hypothetical protein
MAGCYPPCVFRHVALACACLAPVWALGCVRPGAEEADETEETDETSAGESGEDGEFGTLIDHQQWQVVEAADDPFPDHRPELIDCGVAGWLIETDSLGNETLEVRTNDCNYLSLVQPSLMALEQGGLVKLIFYHFDLVAPEPALAHVAILVDGQVLWEQEIAIPGDANVFIEEFESPISAEAGSPVVIHLHNHGQNTWALQDLLAMP